MKLFYLVALLSILWSCQLYQKQIPSEKKKVIAFFGSSVCKGSGDEDSLGYAGRFAQRMDTSLWKYINISKGGDNTIKITRRLNTDLYPLRPNYVVIGLSLSNEGIATPQTDEGRNRIFERFRTGVLRIADSIRCHGTIPIFTNCYARNSFTEEQYLLTRRMNAIINEWPVPSINLLGTINNGFGGWAKGYEANDGHPNRYGHEEMSRAFVPTLFDALEEGKPVPYRNWTSDYIQFFNLKPKSPVLHVVMDTLVHSFAESFMFHVEGEGVIGKIELQKGNCTLEVKEGRVCYTSGAGSLALPLSQKDIDPWIYLTLSHCYANGETYLYVNGNQVGPVKERIKPQTFIIGGYAGNNASVPDTLSIKDWMIHRSSLTQDEARDYMEWKILRSSLEVYAPLVDDSLKAGSVLENRAQSLMKVKLNETAKFRLIKLGFKKNI